MKGKREKRIRKRERGTDKPGLQDCKKERGSVGDKRHGTWAIKN